MTTFIAGKNYLAADRAVMKNRMVFEDAKIRTIKGRIAYFFGSEHPTPDERKLLEKNIYDYIFGKQKAHEAAELWLLHFMESNTLVVMTRKKTLTFSAISRLAAWSPELGAPTRHTGLTVTEDLLETPVVYGSGAELARAGWACGLQPENIILMVQKIDPMSGHGCDVVYREGLRK
ncbi:hypothetical protein PARSHIK_126 [Erwinia phage vB_EamM_Parshik]|uniref:Uncharacterized protein n=1 Tax=Erwinia phage vB_EamM_Huxley TaxID=1883373 RepID=A0A1B2ID48_9CAUD|nr:hypothetical protein BIZ81_gp158 [Erwinia phage vB_EamM_Huxley]ANZ49207.1 hypothetical protein HUXLEY_125 [Erwinia phage vB_EamM_Huxley]ANZ50035.1 hypothetical protein PARSHIK_126 [Erwinia phage vB_EamM_Parshik]